MQVLSIYIAIHTISLPFLKEETILYVQMPKVILSIYGQHTELYLILSVKAAKKKASEIIPSYVCDFQFC